MQNPQQLNVQCTLGAIYLPKIGSLSGLAARYSMHEQGVNSTFSLNYTKSNQRTQFSSNIITLNKGVGGQIPILNLKIGAPMATFAEGSIVPNETAGPYNLIYGASVSSFGLDRYILPTTFNSVSYNTYSGVSNPLNNVVTPSGLDSSPFGYIPLRTGEIRGTSPKKLPTWNIWKQITNNDLLKKFLPGLGVINYNTLNAPHIETTIGAEIPGIAINSANTFAVLERIFPIADDLLYKRPDIYYKNFSTGNIETKQCKASGGPNCGFRINLKNLTAPAPYVGGNGIPSQSSIIIAFGDFFRDSKTPNLATKFGIIITSSGAKLRVYNSVKKQWTTIVLDNQNFLNNGELNVFVHFAGPCMYVGFNENPNDWYVLEPNLENFNFEPRIPADSKISIVVENLSCTFFYSPICFNTLDYISCFEQNDLSETQIQPLVGKSFYKLYFDVDADDGLAKDSINENILKAEFDSRCLPTSSERPNDKPTYHRDWRSFNNATDGLYEFSVKTLKTSEDRVTFPDDPRQRSVSAIIYETTIEGPVFFYARNYIRRVAGGNNTGPIVRNIWGKLSDITKYFVSANIKERYQPNDFYSVKNVTAELNFVNLTNDDVGRQILNAIQENLLVVTLKSGYPDEGIHTFFQGVITEVRVTRSSDSFATKLICQDLGYYLLDNLQFPVFNDLPLGMRTIENILYDSFELLGLSNYLKVRSRISDYDALYDNYFKIAEGDNIYQNSVNDRITHVNFKVKPIQLIENLFSRIPLLTSSDYLLGGLENQPVFRWDPTSGAFFVALRNDEDPDSIWLAGPPGSLQTLANKNISPISNKPSIHGISLGDEAGWTETTNINTLHSDVLITSRLQDGTPYTPRLPGEFRRSFISVERYQELNQLVKEGNNSYQQQIGYIGFNKKKIVELQDQPIYKSKKLVDARLRQEQVLIRYTLQEMLLNVYVTRPLRSHYKFTVESFQGSANVVFDNSYIYSEVVYSIDVNSNLIKAQITGYSMIGG